MSLRVVFDTNTVVSALLFSSGRVAWLRAHWRDDACMPLMSKETAAELHRVLGYPKFGLSVEDRLELLGDYLPYCEAIKRKTQCPARCRDAKDQMFLDLAQSGKADVLVTGDRDLLTMARQTKFVIENPEAYRQRILS